MAIRTLLAATFLAIAVLLAPPPAHATYGDEPPPADDETVIYVMREGRFAGSGVKAWVAVNDRTVARVKNKGHVVVRVPAGHITLNTAGQGAVFASAAVDDRPGETVYLKFRLGDPMEELDEAEAHKFLKKSKRSDPVEELPYNNERYDVLTNISRLGFDLMRPAGDRPEPDDANATVTILRRGDGDKLDFGVWGGHGFVGTLKAYEATTISLPAGEHFFLAGNTGTSVMKLEAQAGKRYYAWVDFGSMVGRVRLTPIESKDADQLEKWLEDVTWVEIDPDTMTERVVERQTIMTDYIEEIMHKIEIGESDYHLLGEAHAF